MRLVTERLCLFSVFVCACSGTVSEPGSQPSNAGSSGATGSASGNGGAGNGASGGGAASSDFMLPSGTGASPRLWRLTAVQYQNAVKDLLNVTVTVPLPADDAGTFGNRADLLDVSPELLQAYADAAEAVANQTMTQLASLLPCQPADPGNATCVASFIRAFGARAWRRPLADDEVASLQKLYTTLTASYDGSAGLSAVLQAFLTSPKFTFRSEIGDPIGGNKRRLTAFEIATALAFTYWNTTPDAALTSAATAGKLSAPADIEAMARTMLGDPRARETTTDFIERWLGIQSVETATKSTKVFPPYSPALMQSMAAEARLFAGSTLWDGSGGVRALLTATTTFVDQKTAPIYGVAAPAAGAAPQAATLDPTQRMGILTQTAFLAAHASEDATKPVLRGQFVRQNLLCQDVPPPPPNVKIDPATLDGTKLTARQRFTMHATDPSCAVCHQLFDGLGFAFENYDGIGRYRTMDNGLPIDASGTILQSGASTDPTFKNALELITSLAANAETYRCFSRKVFESTSGRTPVQTDAADLSRAHAAFAAAGYDVKTLLAALAASDGFLTRGAN